MNEEFLKWLKKEYLPRRYSENMSFKEHVNSDPMRNRTFHIMYTSDLEEAKINKDRDKYDRWGNCIE